MSASRLKVYDKVWVMASNRPAERIVFAVVESADDCKNGVELRYHLVSQMCGAGWGNYEGEIYPPEKIFATKEELIASL